jgi:HEPN domain-containing protein
MVRQQELAMTTNLKEESGSSNPTAQAFLNMAQQYHFAATTLLSASGRAEAPLYFLYTHTIELALKAFLRFHGLSAPRTHALRSLCRQCRAIGLGMHNDLVNVIDLLESESKVHGFRYFVFTSTRPKPNTHDTSRKVIILRVGWGPVTNRVPPVTKTVTSINSIS